MSHRFFGMLTLAVVAPFGTLGCSDPVPQAAGVGLSLNVGLCPTTQSSWTIGEPAPNSGANQFGKPVFSGSSGVSISSCRVSADGQINAEIKGPKGLGFSIKQAKVNLQDGSGTANISFYAGTQAWMTQPFIATDTPCTLQVIKTTTGYKIEQGAVWAQFQCFTMKAAGNVPNCTGTGEIVLERCGD